MKLRTVVSFESNAYQTWQCELLAYTYRVVGQEGCLTGLVSVKSGGEVPKIDECMQIIPTRWVSRHAISKDLYPPYNKPASFCDYFSTVPDRNEMLLLLDPDMVFVKPWKVYGSDAIAELTSYMDPVIHGRNIIARHCKRNRDKVQPVGFPILIHESQLRSIVDRWHILTEEMREDRFTRKDGGWVCEMWAFSVAAAECGVQFKMERRCSFSNEDLGDRCLIHYTYPTVSRSGFFWDKRKYQPWSILPLLRDDVSEAGKVLHGIVDRYRLHRNSHGHRTL